MRGLACLLLMRAALFGCDSVSLLWSPFSDTADPLFRIVVKGRAGFIDTNGRIIIKPTLDPEFTIQSFHEGLLPLNISACRSSTSRDGKFSTMGFIGSPYFSEGVAAALEAADSKWGYIDRSGQFAIPPQFPAYPGGLVSDFSDGLAAIEISGKLGYIDHSGTFVIPPRFVAGTHFENGVARVVADGPCAYFDDESTDPCSELHSAPTTSGPHAATRSFGTFCKWRFIDKTGKQVLDAEFDGAMGFHEGLAAVKVGDLWGFVNLQGSFVIPPSFNAVRSFTDGLALIRKENESGFIDKTGTLKISVDFSRAQPFSEGLALVSPANGGYIYIHQSGKQAIRERFVLASRFFHGLAHVKLNGPPEPFTEGTFAYIDKTGKHVFEYRIDRR